eukprot:12981762-Alexandrium_andersonii.AAC.1
MGSHSRSGRMVVLKPSARDSPPPDLNAIWRHLAGRRALGALGHSHPGGSLPLAACPVRRGPYRSGRRW